MFENKVMEKFDPVHQIVGYCEDTTKEGKMGFKCMGVNRRIMLNWILYVCNVCLRGGP
jgi:hypothetical protein